jgi:BirA family biotin operon repressor/biotin-[acetyl-CoA-carboxylase] ligase
VTQPSGRVLQRLVTGPTLVSRVTWFDRIGSTNAEAARWAAQGAESGLLVLADEQTSGRGRQGRSWSAPPGTSLMGSLLLRTDRDLALVALLPLLIGLALAEAAEVFVSGAELSLKWPNDLLAEGRKCAGILVEAPARGVVVVGMGVNVDWRAVDRPDELVAATSLSEVGRGPVDRWRLLPLLIERLDRRYQGWREDPTDFLPAYRERCATLGHDVRVEQADGTRLVGAAAGVTDGGALLVETDAGRTVELRAGEVHHLRHR